MAMVTDPLTEGGDIYTTLLDMKQDKYCIDDFVMSVGTGCESLPDTPASALINRFMHEKYPDHCRLSNGSEALGLIIGLSALLAIGINALNSGKAKEMANSGKVPSSNVKSVVSNIRTGYDLEWVDDKKPTEVSVSAGKLTKRFKGDTYQEVIDNALAYARETVPQANNAYRHVSSAWSTVKPYMKKFIKGDEADRNLIVAEIKSKFKGVPGKTYPKINTSPPSGSGGPLPAMTKNEYKKAVSALVTLVKTFAKIDDVLFDKLPKVGFVDISYPAASSRYVKDLKTYGHADALTSGIYTDLTKVRTILVEAAHGLEEYINNSFK